MLEVITGKQKIFVDFLLIVKDVVRSDVRIEVTQMLTRALVRWLEPSIYR
jgi:hypothetical protein